MESPIPEILQTYQSITLQEMNAIRLMNRIDTKFLTTTHQLQELLTLAKEDYRVQEINGERIASYYTLYYDTPQHQMFLQHHNGCTPRQKVRIRSYLDAGLKYLEVKSKNNKERTDKKRIPIERQQVDPSAYSFLSKNTIYAPQSLQRQLENRFHRITLVNKELTERLTIDGDIFFHNLETEAYYQLNQLIVIELKRDGRTHSLISDYLRELRIKPSGFSKYCIGSALTNNQLKQNRFKKKLHDIQKLMNSEK